MTSSLVGSEMCIRDSCMPHTSLAPTVHRASYRHRPLLPTPTPTAVLHVPVSYTHLTLPTICSV
eukprot:5093718-Prorocentrum_lima.AAC.1